MPIILKIIAFTEEDISQLLADPDVRNTIKQHFIPTIYNIGVNDKSDDLFAISGATTKRQVDRRFYRLRYYKSGDTPAEITQKNLKPRTSSLSKEVLFRQCSDWLWLRKFEALAEQKKVLMEKQNFSEDLANLVFEYHIDELSARMSSERLILEAGRRNDEVRKEVFRETQNLPKSLVNLIFEFENGFPPMTSKGVILEAWRRNELSIIDVISEDIRSEIPENDLVLSAVGFLGDPFSTNGPLCHLRICRRRCWVSGDDFKKNSEWLEKNFPENLQEKVKKLNTKIWTLLRNTCTSEPCSEEHFRRLAGSMRVGALRVVRAITTHWKHLLNKTPIHGSSTGSLSSSANSEDLNSPQKKKSILIWTGHI